ncbi:hypothetical protein RB2654_15240 [Rhodobacterales bacterium HTCC2654]|uniref:Uncharacterized protein n=1 Tax=Maritimibacter alkaliphilus HTCC2654 TaxID=314271 RepID=A3VH97_9RHOB|nr:hypothetical protein RB2654_15240 [Rhodobacterales bacterium HTCC2654] [Maritimibacter alkaliphilus HTCC2654]
MPNSNMLSRMCTALPSSRPDCSRAWNTSTRCSSPDAGA